jgi:tetratricopeptide (TPR) repeat protein
MLFDLRGSGRRATIKVVYLFLAVLLGGGLVLFGIGGDVSGGLVDAITERGAGTDTSADRYRDRAAAAQRAAQANPEDAAAWAAVARARYQLAGAGEFFDPQTGQFSEEGKAELQRAATAWERHLALDPKQPDDSVASLMVQAYSQTALNQPEKSVQAQEVITEARPKASTFANLAVLAYQAGQTRKGDLATAEALRRSDKADRETLKAELESAKQQSATQQLQDATGGEATPPAGGAAPAPEEPTGGGGGGGGN